jgi:hypothetical protein
VATIDQSAFAADAGAGMEGADRDSFAIPFLSVLQKSSPTVDEALPTFVEGHKAGQLYENVGGKTFDGKKGILIVPCAFRRVFIRWGARGTDGSGFKGEYAPEDVAQMRADGKIVDLDGKLLVPLSDGTVNEKKCDRFSDTRNHYVLMIDEETGGWREALLSLTSTQIKKSKALMSALAGVKMKSASGLYTPPAFANVVRITTLGESNDKGSWHGVKMAIERAVDRADLYAAAKAFHASVKSGSVEAKYEDVGEAAPAASGF